MTIVIIIRKIVERNTLAVHLGCRPCRMDSRPITTVVVVMLSALSPWITNQ